MSHKIILIILNCFKNSYKREQQRKHWLKKPPKNIQYFHIIGNKDQQEDCISNQIYFYVYMLTAIPKRVPSLAKTLGSLNTGHVEAIVLNSPNVHKRKAPYHM